MESFYKETLLATTDLYVSMHVLDLQDGIVTTIKTNEHILKWSEGLTSPQDIITNVMAHLADPETREAILDFTVLSSLPERLKEQSVISHVFRGNVNGWCNARFIRIDNEKPLRRVIYVVENVDTQTQELEALKAQKAETVKLQHVLDGLVDEYSTVCSADLKTGKFDIYKMNGRIKSILTDIKAETSYQEAVDMYIGRAVHEEDKAEIRNLLNAEHILKQLDKNHSFSKSYRNNEGRFGEVKVIRTGNATVLMGFMEKHEELSDFYQQIYIDSLTKVKNRKFLDEKLLLERCEGVVMADIDYFKSINDTAGHQCGDDAIAAVASVMSNHVRNSDFVVRYGGDEFLLAFPRITFDGFKLKMEQIRQAIQEIKLPNYPDVRLTMSFGGVHGEGAVHQMISRADNALYESKKNRNSVTIMYMMKKRGKEKS